MQKFVFDFTRTPEPRRIKLSIPFSALQNSPGSARQKPTTTRVQPARPVEATC